MTNRTNGELNDALSRPPDVRKSLDKIKNGMAVSRNFSFMAPITAVAKLVALPVSIRVTAILDNPSATPIGARMANKPNTTAKSSQPT